MPAKELGKSSNYWDKRRLLKYTESERKSKKYINDIRSIYNKANEDIDKMLEDVYRNYAKDTGLDVQQLKSLLTKSETKKTWKELEKQGLDKYIKTNYKSRITRLEQIKAQVYAKAKSVYKQEELKQTELYKSVINDSYYKAIYNTQMGTGLNFAFSRIDNNTMNSLLSNRWSGVNYSKRIWTNTDILADEASKIVGGSLLSGKGVELTARQIRDRFSVSKYYAERLVRTEMNYYENQADAMAYEEMGVEEFVPVAVLDNRTSQYCADIDGKHFKYSEMEVGVNYPPFHPNCRCTTRGYLGKEAEKLLTRRARNPITGQNEVISNMSYNEWKSKYIEIENSELPRNIYNILQDQRQPNELEERIFEKYLTKDNIMLSKSKKDVMYYSHKYDKIVINPNHPALEEYDVYKSLTHEITHMIDNRTSFGRNNSNVLLQYMENSNKYIMNNKNYFKELFKKETIESNMDISDLFGAITNNKIHGVYSHDLEYWSNDNSRRAEMIADMVNIYISNDKEAVKLISEIPPLERAYRKVVNWYEKNI